MEYLNNILKKTGMYSLISSIVFAILGIVLIAYPEGTIKVISYIIGIMFMLVGVYKIINYITNKGNYDLYNYDLAFGIIAIVLGIVTIAYGSKIVSIFRIIIGLWIIYSAIIRFSLSLKLKALETDAWKYSFILAIIMLICGIYAIANTGIIIVTIGVIVLIYAITDIIESIIFIKNIKEM